SSHSHRSRFRSEKRTRAPDLTPRVTAGPEAISTVEPYLAARSLAPADSVAPERQRIALSNAPGESSRFGDIVHREGHAEPVGPGRVTMARAPMPRWFAGSTTPARHNCLMALVVVFGSGDRGDRRGGQLTAVSQVWRRVPSWP